MLCITMRKGDYFLIGKDIVVQLDTLSGSRVHLTINAPKDVPIVRGASAALNRITCSIISAVATPCGGG